MTHNRILIVEDDPDVRLGFQVFLTAHHYETFFADNAIAALAESRAHDPDLIILDLGLPGIDGFDLLEQFGSLYVSMVPVIVVSARDRHVNKERALKAGAMAYVQKPWNDDELLDVIDRYSADPSFGPAPSPSAPPPAAVPPERASLSDLMYGMPPEPRGLSRYIGYRHSPSMAEMATQYTKRNWLAGRTSKG